MLRITEADNLEQIFQYQKGFDAPFLLDTEYCAWRKSFEEDVDGEGRTLFRQLCAKAVWDGGRLSGFVQYGKTAFGFDRQGEMSDCVSHCVIRNLYFDRDRPDAGALLLGEALRAFEGCGTVYAFFHYFGMSCFARHGKLYEQHRHIEALLKEHGFETEHENVYYSLALRAGRESEVELIAHDLTAGGQQCFDFVLAGRQVGGCEVHYPGGKTAYLRWIYVNGELTGRGIGTKCMDALQQRLIEKGLERLDTDTALSNLPAQRYYEKNGFVRRGITRSYLRG